MGDLYYGTTALHSAQYICKLEDHLPGKDMGVWDMSQGNRMDYYAAIRIRDSAVSVGEGLKRNSPKGKRGETTCAVMDISKGYNYWEMKKATRKESPSGEKK